MGCLQILQSCRQLFWWWWTYVCPCGVTHRLADNYSIDDEAMSCPPSGSTLSHTLSPSVAVDDKGALECREHEAFFWDRLLQLHALVPSQQFEKLFLSYTSDPQLDLAKDTFDILGYLALYYVFVPPMPLQSPSPVNLKDWEQNIKNVGLDVCKNPPSVDYALPVVNFLKRFLLTAGPSEEFWDLCPGNCRHIDKECLSQIFTKRTIFSSWTLPIFVMNLVVLGQSLWLHLSTPSLSTASWLKRKFLPCHWLRFLSMKASASLLCSPWWWLWQQAWGLFLY